MEFSKLSTIILAPVSKLLIVFLCFFSLQTVIAQDFIVTFSKDTINCKIEKAKKNYIKYFVNNNSEYVHTDTILAYKINGSNVVEISHSDNYTWNDSVKYIASVSVGTGITHCGAGVKTIIGLNGLTGLLLGAGSDGKNILWQVGVTGRIMNAYAAISFGTVDYYKLFNSYISDDEKNIRGISMELGYLFYFGKDKRFFVNAALDATRYYYTQHYSYEPLTQDVWDFGFGFDAGIGIRF